MAAIERSMTDRLKLSWPSGEIVTTVDIIVSTPSWEIEEIIGLLG
jgi:hypothetical protein